jgi:CheY-like chemotaxis protein
MAEPQDKIAQLLQQVRTHLETAGSGANLNAGELRALKILLLALAGLAEQALACLKEIVEVLSNMNFERSGHAALFSETGKLLYWGESLQSLVDRGSAAEDFSIAFESLKFLEAAAGELAAAGLPWKNAEASVDESRRWQLAAAGCQKWFACLVSRLQEGCHGAVATPGAAAVKAACFGELSGLMERQERLAAVSASFAAALAEMERTIFLIECLQKRSGQAPQQAATADEPEQETLAPSSRDRPPVAAAGQSSQVLLVEADPLACRLMGGRLAKLGLEAVFASCSWLAAPAALAGNHALIFLDCSLPESGVFELTRQIRAAELESGQHVPIVALTACDCLAVRNSCLSAGMDEYMSKWAPESLFREVVEWCLLRGMVRLDKDLSVDDYEEDLDLPALGRTFSKAELNDLLEQFLPSTNTLMRCLRMSMDERDWRSTAHFAYSLKGPFAAFGMDMTCKLAARLVDAAEENQWEEANDYYEMLRRNWEAVRTQLEERAARQG